MRSKVQRNNFSRYTNSFSSGECASPGNESLELFFCKSEKLSLCALKGSLTVETAMILPFFLMILLAFFSFFFHYASAAELKVKAAADAKKLGIAIGSIDATVQPEVTIYKRENEIVQKAVCRSWIGFAGLEIREAIVYMTPEGEVYHLYADCTHLELSIQCVSDQHAKTAKNLYGEKYRKCELCKEPFEMLVYITSEGNCYHSQRNCGGLKRTIRQIPLSESGGKRCCLRCMVREETISGERISDTRNRNFVFDAWRVF